jgi:hypothetical protein
MDTENGVAIVVRDRGPGVPAHGCCDAMQRPYDGQGQELHRSGRWVITI